MTEFGETPERNKNMSENQWLQLVGLIMAATLVVPAALSAAKGRLLLYAVAWLALIAALVWGYQTFGAG